MQEHITTITGNKLITIFRDQATAALAGFHAGLSWSIWNMEMLVFQENPEKNPRSKREPTTNSTHIRHSTRIEPGPSHCWVQALSTLHNFFSPVQSSESSFSAYNHQYKSCEVFRRQILEN